MNKLKDKAVLTNMHHKHNNDIGSMKNYLLVYFNAINVC